MKWNKYTIKTLSSAEDILSAALAELGVQGVEIEDKVPLTKADKERMFVDILPDMPEDDGVAYLNFYLEPDEDNEGMLARIKEELAALREFTDIGEGTIARSETEDIDWVNNWKQYFHQFYVDDILITPSWEEVKPEDKDRLTIRIDPGAAFGTGLHETTQLVIRQLKKYVTDTTELLDVGCGSGILSIAALLLGAKHAVGTDLDSCAVSAARENMEANGIAPESMDVYLGNLVDDRTVQNSVGYGQYDVAAANILAEVLVPLTPAIKGALKPGGIYIASGILAEKENVVVRAMRAAGFAVLEVTGQGEWVCVTARRIG